MPTEIKSSRLLEQLRQKSDAARKAQTEQMRPIEEALRDIDRQLWSAFRWLEEALRHLEVIRPEVQHTFTLLGVLSIGSPRYQHGFISYRRRAVAGMELLDHVELYYRLALEAPIVMRVQPGSANAMEERLRSANLQFRYDQEHDGHGSARRGVFTIKPEITSSVRMEPDYRAQRIEVTLRNIDRFESIALDFAPNALGEPALEDLVHLVLGENNRFLRRAPLAGLKGRAPRVAVA